MMGLRPADPWSAYALKSFKQPIGISDYQLSKAVPEELKSQLPQIDELEKELINQ